MDDPVSVSDLAARELRGFEVGYLCVCVCSVSTPARS